MPSINKLLQAAAGNAGESLYVEDVFSTYLYTGNGSTQSITNDIDISTEGGMVWIKNRDAADGHVLTDTERGAGEVLASNSTAAEVTNADTTTAFNSDGFSIGADVIVNTNTEDYASWTFRKAEKFFDVVTYTGDGTNGREIPHSLAGDVGMVIVKCTSDADQWLVWHKSTPTGYLRLDGTGALVTSFAQFKFGNGTTTVNPTSSVFTVAGDSDINGSGRTYVAYLFAHDAGGFGDDGSENIITCGSYEGNDSNTIEININLGFEPQWLLIKNADLSRSWTIVDMMRGLIYGPLGSGAGTTDRSLSPNLSSDEETCSTSSVITRVDPTSTGFAIRGKSAICNEFGTHIYIAIRRPMKTPESGTEVFAADNAANSTAPWFTSGFPVDWAWQKQKNASSNWNLGTRLLQGSSLRSDSTVAELTYYSEFAFDYMDGWNSTAGTASNMYSAMFKRATGFMDVVAYTGTGSATTQAHNLGVVPEMMIIKNRDQADNWAVYHNGIGPTKNLKLNLTNAEDTDSRWWDDTAPTDSIFSLSYIGDVNASGENYIAYLFATLAGVSKVGSYTGTAASLDLDMGFAAGARFFLCKRTDSTGDWYVYDSVRGIVAGNDPYLLLNSAAAEVTGTDYVDPLASGITLTAAGSATINVSSGSYIFLAIA
jgi:hypothetical protein